MPFTFQPALRALQQAHKHFPFFVCLFVFFFFFEVEEDFFKVPRCHIKAPPGHLKRLLATSK